MNSNSNNSNPLQLSDVEVEYFCNTWYSFFFNQNVDPNPVNVQNIALNVAALAHNYYSPIIMMHVNNNQQLATQVQRFIPYSVPFGPLLFWPFLISALSVLLKFIEWKNDRTCTLYILYMISH